MSYILLLCLIWRGVQGGVHDNFLFRRHGRLPWLLDGCLVSAFPVGCRWLRQWWDLRGQKGEFSRENQEVKMVNVHPLWLWFTMGWSDPIFMVGDCGLSETSMENCSMFLPGISGWAWKGVRGLGDNRKDVLFPSRIASRVDSSMLFHATWSTYRYLMIACFACIQTEIKLAFNLEYWPTAKSCYI